MILIITVASCKKDRLQQLPVPFDFTQHYIAGKMMFLNGAKIPFALIPGTEGKAIFVYSAGKTEVDYTYKDHQFSANIKNEVFSCTITKGKIENISGGSSLFGIATAMLYKKQDPSRSFAGKRFEGTVKQMNNQRLYDNYYFQFDSSLDQTKYLSGTLPANAGADAKNYSLLAEGCLYDEQAKTFGILLDDKLEIQTKLNQTYVLFSGTQQ